MIESKFEDNVLEGGGGVREIIFVKYIIFDIDEIANEPDNTEIVVVMNFPANYFHNLKKNSK